MHHTRVKEEMIENLNFKARGEKLILQLSRNQEQN